MTLFTANGSLSMIQPANNGYSSNMAVYPQAYFSKGVVVQLQCDLEVAISKYVLSYWERVKLLGASSNLLLQRYLNIESVNHRSTLVMCNIGLAHPLTFRLLCNEVIYQFIYGAVLQKNIRTRLFCYQHVRLLIPGNLIILHHYKIMQVTITYLTMNS